MLLAITLASVAFLRVPDGGIQPQTAVDQHGHVHLVYFKGAPRAGDLFYSVRRNGTFSTPKKVNTSPGSAIAIGTIRGAQIALGPNQRVHVLWNGGPDSPKGVHGGSPLFYTRSAPDGSGFEPERDLIVKAAGLDGGSGLAADQQGRVLVTWHAAAPGQSDEAGRKIYVRESADGGIHFGAERAADGVEGVCACCGMRALAFGQNQTAIFYRQARNQTERDMVLLTLDTSLQKSVKVQPWKIATCPMSSCSLAPAPDGLLVSWETEGQVYFSSWSSGEVSAPIAPPGRAARKHPVVARNQKGEVLLAWTENTGWNRGGAVAWQLFDSEQRPTAERGRKEGVPVWGSIAAWTDPEGNFTVLY